MAEPVAGTFFHVFLARLWEALANGIFRFLLRRFVRLEDEAGKVEIRLRGENPIDFGLNMAVPQVNVWMEIVNHSYLDFALDRMDLEVWAGQPVARGVMGRRIRISRHTTATNIHFGAQLSAAAVDQVKRNTEQPSAASATCAVYGTAYLDSVLGSVEIQLSKLERRVCQC